MRKVHEKAVRLLLDGREGRPGPRDQVKIKDRTLLPCKLTPVFWLYHDNAIARVDDEGIFVNWQGWFAAPSTTLRISALCGHVGAAMPEKKEGWIKIA